MIDDTVKIISRESYLGLLIVEQAAPRKEKERLKELVELEEC